MKTVYLLCCLITSPVFCKSKVAADLGGTELYLSRQEFMDIKVAEKRFGIRSLVENEFRKGTVDIRAPMAVFIVKSGLFSGKSTQQVRQILGPSTGHFWNDTVPAYIIEEGWRKQESTWQLVFLLRDDGRVLQSKIHKNCCPN